MSVRWGILGTAGIAAGCTIPGLKEAAGCELYAIAGRDIKKAEDFKEKFGFKKAYEGYDTLLSDPDVQAVYVPLPNNLHCEWTIKALEAGKHVLCEKPLAMDPSEVRRMFECAGKNGVHLMEAYAYLHSPYIEALKNDISSGLIGKVDFIDTAFVTQGYKEDFRLHKPLGGGAFYDVGCYCTTMILTVACASRQDASLPEVEDIKAVAEFSEEDVDLVTTGFIKLKNGDDTIRAGFNVGMILGEDSNDRFDRLYIHGSKGCIRSNVEYNQNGDLSYEVCTDGKIIERKVFARQNYALEAEQFCRAIEGREKPMITPEFSILNADIMARILGEIGY